MKEHSLLQAIARVNRTYDKTYRIMEDGKEIEKTPNKSIRQVLSITLESQGICKRLWKFFDINDVGQPMEDIDSLYKRMLDYKESAMRIFTGVDKKRP